MACCALVAGYAGADHGRRRSGPGLRRRHAELRGRERDGLIELPKAPGLKPGDHVRIIAGPFSERLALYEGQTSHERVAVLLQFLGGRHRRVAGECHRTEGGRVVTLPEAELSFYFAALAA